MRFNSLDIVQKASLTVGVLFILLSAVSNTFLLGFLFSEDRQIEFPNTFLIYFFQIGAFIWGTCLILSVKKPNLLAILWGAGAAVILLLSLETISSLIVKHNSDTVIDTTEYPLFADDLKTGFQLNKNLHTRVSKVFNSDTVFDVTYHTDNLGRRLVLDFDTGKRNKFIAFFGCSRIFGNGLNDNETLPYFTQKNLTAYRVYNYAVPGYGTQQVYAQIIERPLEKEITEEKGIGLYNLTEDHIYRTIGSLDVYNLWGKNMPYYTSDGDSVLFKGSFTTGRRFKSLIYTLLWKSSFLKLIHFNLPLSLSKRDTDLVIKLIQSSAEKLRSRFPNSEFYVTLYPTLENPHQLKKLLQLNNIKVIDLSRLFDASDTRYSITGDGHPSRLANETIAYALSDILRKI